MRFRINAAYPERTGGNRVTIGGGARASASPPPPRGRHHRPGSALACARPDPRVHGRGGSGWPAGVLAGAALRRCPHAHRCRSDRAGPRRRAACEPAGGGGYTFGLKRAEILSAQVNGVTLVALAAVILFEGIRRLVEPLDVEGTAVLVVALAGIVVNLAATFTLAGADRRSLNVEGAFQHVLMDLFAFIATAIAGVVILTTGWVQRGRGGCADRGLPDAALGLGAAARLGARAARGRAARDRPGRDRPHARRPAPRGRGSRPARVGGHVGHALAVCACDRRCRLRPAVAPPHSLRRFCTSASASTTRHSRSRPATRGRWR